MTKDVLWRHLQLLFRLHTVEAAVELAFTHGDLFELIRQEEGAYESRGERRFPVTFWTKFWEEYRQREVDGRYVTPVVEDSERMVGRR